MQCSRLQSKLQSNEPQLALVSCAERKLLCRKEKSCQVCGNCQVNGSTERTNTNGQRTQYNVVKCLKKGPSGQVKPQWLSLSLSRHFQYINYSSSNYLELLEMSIGDTETSISSFLRLVTMFAIATTDYNS